jgi:hypothetical protein
LKEVVLGHLRAVQLPEHLHRRPACRAGALGAVLWACAPQLPGWGWAGPPPGPLIAGGCGPPGSQASRGGHARGSGVWRGGGPTCGTLPHCCR